ncbi:hypothetical protein Poli38472_007873 [Pythium oligandrum]|uniref:Uncharacterized protein n=1 Tax=Pythium oligandrum TaxID=41045 RepID=A0A8K1CT86_PYTOL|nr:hypothetical protein Poli38472_007873 [Pythium oligandrum]|eukprot:TMW68201.1 hypothetical protein Poli38472_007873 [Pythium oligandrum]
MAVLTTLMGCFVSCFVTLWLWIRFQDRVSVVVPWGKTEEQCWAPYPETPWDVDEFECLEWVATDEDGTPTGETRECWQRVRGGEAGFCRIRNVSSANIFHVMHTTRLSLKDEVRFTCGLAKAFTEFRHLAKDYTHDPPMLLPQGELESIGIVMAVYDQVLASAYASIRQLRSTGCQLPIELWFRHDELKKENTVIHQLMTLFGPIKLRVIHDDRIRGFYVKVHAVYYSSFTSVLLLDADNFVVQSPTPLFSSATFQAHGAVFWPDFWHPGNTIFNIHAQSLLWELLGIEYVDMMEQESGQVLINRQKSRVALEKLMFLATNHPNLLRKLKLVWGDKDLFRLAWFLARKTFYFNDRRVPGALGVINHDRQRFCGMSMVQYDLDGQSILFVHRNTIKLTGQTTEKRIWHTLQEYEPGVKPVIHSFNGDKLFNETSCFGVKRFQFPEQHSTVRMRSVFQVPLLRHLEDKLSLYAAEASLMVHNRGNPSYAWPITPRPCDG